MLCLNYKYHLDDEEECGVPFWDNWLKPWSMLLQVWEYLQSTHWNIATNTLLQCWYKYVVAMLVEIRCCNMLVEHRHIAMLGSICSLAAPYWELVLCAQCASPRISGTLCCHVHPNTPQPISFCNSLSFETKSLNFIFWVETEHVGIAGSTIG